MITLSKHQFKIYLAFICSSSCQIRVTWWQHHVGKFSKIPQRIFADSPKLKKEYFLSQKPVRVFQNYVIFWTVSVRPLPGLTFALSLAYTWPAPLHLQIFSFFLNSFLLDFCLILSLSHLHQSDLVHLTVECPYLLTWYLHCCALWSQVLIVFPQTPLDWLIFQQALLIWIVYLSFFQILSAQLAPFNFLLAGVHPLLAPRNRFLYCLHNFISRPGLLLRLFSSS